MHIPKQEKYFVPGALEDPISSPSNALNWLCDLFFVVKWKVGVSDPWGLSQHHPALRIITCVTMCTLLHNSSKTSHMQLTIIVYLLISLNFIWGDITGLSHDDIVSCHLISGDSTLCCYRLSANNQDYMFCLLWLFCGFWGGNADAFQLF